MSLAPEFVGPLGGWRNVKTDYGAAGDGTTDDWGAFSDAFAELLDGTYKTLYVPAGDYRCTSGLYLRYASPNSQLLNVVGEDPATTRLFWDAAPTEFMALVNMEGIHYAKISRLTLDGGGNAWAGLRVDGWNGAPPGYFPTGTELSDLYVTGCDRGVLLQYNESIGVSEVMFRRCKFDGNDRIDVRAGGFNTLDLWFWDCHFAGGAIAIGNHDRDTSGAGNFHAFRTLFEGYTDTALLVGNTQGHNFEACWFRNNNRVYDSYGVGASSPTTFKGCTILDCTQDQAISQANAGPLFLFDTTIRSGVGVTAAVAGGANVIRGGNTYSSSGQAGGTLDLVVDTETVVARAAIAPTWPTWVGFTPKVARTVFEVATGATAATIQTAIDDAVAVNNRAVVHLQATAGSPPAFSVGSTLVVPAGADIQIVGDGRATEVKWAGAGSGPVFHFQGPGNHALLSNVRVHGNDQVTGVLVDDADQAGGLVLFEQPFAEQNTIGWRFEHLTDTKVELRGDGVGSAGVAVPAGTGLVCSAAEVVQWGGAYGTNFDTCWTIRSGGRAAIFHTWYESETPEAVHPGATLGEGFPCGRFVRWGGVEVAPDANHGGAAGPDTATVHVEDFHGRVVYVGTAVGEACTFRRWDSRFDAPLLSLGSTGTLTPYFVDEHGFSRGAQIHAYRSTTAADEPTYSVGTSVGITDTLSGITSAQRAAFVKEQLAWPRSLAPHDEHALDYAEGVTQVQFSRVDSVRSVVGIDVRGSVPALSGTPAAADLHTERVTWLVADAEVATFLKHAAFLDPVGGGSMTMPALAASGDPGTRTHRWCGWQMTALQREELEARVASQITATTVKVYAAGETPAAVLSANGLVRM